MSVWEDIRIIWEAHRTTVKLEQHTKNAGSCGVRGMSSTGCEACLRHLRCYCICL